MRRVTKRLLRRALLGAVAAALCGAAAGAAWGWAWLHGPGFRGLAERGLGRALRAEAAMQPVSWAGLGRARTGGVVVRGKPGAAVALAEAGETVAELNPGALFGREVEITGIRIASARVVIAPPGGAAAGEPAEDGAPPRGIGAVLAGLFAPRSLSLGPIRVERADIEWPTPLGAGGLRGGAVVARQSGAQWLVEARGGRLRAAPALPELELVGGVVRIGGGVVEIEECELAAPGSAGRLRVAGRIAPETDLSLVFEGLELAALLPPGAGSPLSGGLEGVVTLRGGAAEGALRLAGGRLRGGAAMEKAARFTGRPEYTDMPLSVAEAEFRSGPGGGRVEVARMAVESAGLLAVEGGFETDTRRIEGVFELGLPPEVLRRLPGSATAVFTREERGYRWTRVRVAGPLDAPGNDLAGRLIAAPLNAAFKGVGNVVGRTFDAGGRLVAEGAGRAAETGRAAARTVADGAGTVIEGAGGVVGGGVKLIGEGAGRVLDVLPFGGGRRGSNGEEGR